MAGFSLAVAVLLSSAVSAHPPSWHHPDAQAGYNDTCREAAPYISALRSYDAASSLCSSVLGLGAHTVTETSTRQIYATLNRTSTASTAYFTASAPAIQLPTVTVTGNSSTTTVYSNNTLTITREASMSTAPASTSYTTLTSTATICGNSSAGLNVTANAKRQLVGGWGGKPQWHGGNYGGPDSGWRHPHDLPPALEGSPLSAISSGCSCMSLPAETSTVTAYTMKYTNYTRVDLFTASATVNFYRSWANTTTIRPLLTRTITSTRTVQSQSIETPIITSTIITTTTVLIGQQYGTPTVVLARPTAITGIDSDGLATQDFDDERYPIQLPFEIEAYGVRSSNIMVAVNGWIALTNDTGTVDHYSFDNAQLPRMNTDDDWGLPDTAFLPYWNDLFVAQGTAQGLYYEIGGEAPSRNASFEWYTSLYSQALGYYHFIATFQEAKPGAVVYTYYQANGEVPLNTGKYGTIGVQSFIHDDSAQHSYDHLVAPGLEITYDPLKNTFVRTNSVNCVLST